MLLWHYMQCSIYQKCVKIRFQLSKGNNLIMFQQQQKSGIQKTSKVSSAATQWTKPWFYPRHLRDLLLAGLTWMAVSWLNLSWQLWDVHTVLHSGLWDYAKQSNLLALMDQKTCMATKIRIPNFYFMTKKKNPVMVIVLCLFLKSFYIAKATGKVFIEFMGYWYSMSSVLAACFF